MRYEKKTTKSHVLTHIHTTLFKDTSHVEICSILCIQFVLCMGYPFMK